MDALLAKFGVRPEPIVADEDFRHGGTERRGTVGETRDGIEALLRRRYRDGHVYTFLGGILLALNPYRRLEYCQNDTFAALYHNARMPGDQHVPRHSAKEDDTMPSLLLPGTAELFSNAPAEDSDGEYLPAHAIAVAEAAYRSVLEQSSAISVVVVGENGAGKTETCKIVANYLVMRPGGDTSLGRFQHLIRSMDVVLEAFGNAYTPQNSNSSRFARALKLRYHASSGALAGASLETYLLEKNRIVARGSAERSFHIFYQLCRGCTDATERETIDVRGVGGYAYLRGEPGEARGIVDDRTAFAATKAALLALGISADEQIQLFRAVNAVMLLGNVSFTSSAGSDRRDGCAIAPGSPLKQIGKLIGVDEDLLDSWLRFRHMTGGRISSFLIALSSADAVDIRDTIAKTLYGAIFSWLVARINGCIAHAGSSRATHADDEEDVDATREAGDDADEDELEGFWRQDTTNGNDGEFSGRYDSSSLKAFDSNGIGGNKRAGEMGGRSEACINLLDVFGFESFDASTSSFEHFGINYFSEKMHHKFLQDTAARTKILLAEGGFDESDVETFAVDVSEECIDVLDRKRPYNIFSLLQEECQIPDGSDLSLLLKMNKYLSNRPAFVQRNIDSDQAFTLRHSAGEVTYKVAGFVRNNTDRSNTAFSLSLSTLPFVRELHDIIHDAVPRTSSDGEEQSYQNGTTTGSGGGVGGGLGSPAVQRHRTNSLGRWTPGVMHCFRNETESLLKNINVNHVKYIKCISANKKKMRGNFDPAFVERQLRYQSVLNFNKLRERFRMHIQLRLGALKARFGILLHNSALKLSDESVAILIARVAGLDRERDYKLGAQTIVLNGPAEYNALHDAKMRIQLLYFHKIERGIKFFQMRRFYSARFIQRKWRLRHSPEEALKKHAARVILRVWRQRHARRCRKKMIDAVATYIMLSIYASKWRATMMMKAERRRYLKLQSTAIFLQRTWRSARIRIAMMHELQEAREAKVQTRVRRAMYALHWRWSIRLVVSMDKYSSRIAAMEEEYMMMTRARGALSCWRLFASQARSSLASANGMLVARNNKLTSKSLSAWSIGVRQMRHALLRIRQRKLARLLLRVLRGWRGLVARLTDARALSWDYAYHRSREILGMTMRAWNTMTGTMQQARMHADSLAAVKARQTAAACIGAWKTAASLQTRRLMTFYRRMEIGLKRMILRAWRSRTDGTASWRNSCDRMRRSISASLVRRCLDAWWAQAQDSVSTSAAVTLVGRRSARAHAWSSVERCFAQWASFTASVARQVSEDTSILQWAFQIWCIAAKERQVHVAGARRPLGSVEEYWARRCLTKAWAGWCSVKALLEQARMHADTLDAVRCRHVASKTLFAWRMATSRACHDEEMLVWRSLTRRSRQAFLEWRGRVDSMKRWRDMCHCMSRRHNELVLGRCLIGWRVSASSSAQSTSALAPIASRSSERRLLTLTMRAWTSLTLATQQARMLAAYLATMKKRQRMAVCIGAWKAATSFQKRSYTALYRRMEFGLKLSTLRAWRSRIAGAASWRIACRRMRRSVSISLQRRYLEAWWACVQDRVSTSAAVALLGRRSARAHAWSSAEQYFVQWSGVTMSKLRRRARMSTLASMRRRKHVARHTLSTWARSTAGAKRMRARAFSSWRNASSLYSDWTDARPWASWIVRDMGSRRSQRRMTTAFCEWTSRTRSRRVRHHMVRSFRERRPLTRKCIHAWRGISHAMSRQRNSLAALADVMMRRKNLSMKDTAFHNWLAWAAKRAIAKRRALALKSRNRVRLLDSHFDTWTARIAAREARAEEASRKAICSLLKLCMFGWYDETQMSRTADRCHRKLMRRRSHHVLLAWSAEVRASKDRAASNRHCASTAFAEWLDTCSKRERGRAMLVHACRRIGGSMLLRSLVAWRTYAYLSHIGIGESHILETLTQSFLLRDRYRIKKYSFLCWRDTAHASAARLKLLAGVVRRRTRRLFVAWLFSTAVLRRERLGLLRKILDRWRAAVNARRSLMQLRELNTQRETKSREMKVASGRLNDLRALLRSLPSHFFFSLCGNSRAHSTNEVTILPLPCAPVRLLIEALFVTVEGDTPQSWEEVSKFMLRSPGPLKRAVTMRPSDVARRAVQILTETYFRDRHFALSSIMHYSAMCRPIQEWIMCMVGLAQLHYEKKLVSSSIRRIEGQY